MLIRFRAFRARVRAPLALLLAAGLTAAAAGCGSSSDNGVASKTPTEILAASKAAADSASSVRVVSAAAQGPLKLTSNLEFASNGGHAQVAFVGLSFEVLRIENTLYVKGNRAFMSRLNTPAAKNLPAGAWLKAPVSNTQLAQLSAFTSKSGELNRLMGTTGPLTKGGTTTVSGQKVLELKEVAKLFNGVTYIATTGQPYPVQQVKHGRETGLTSWTDWNKPITLTAPSNAVELSQLEHKH
jgi:hypothetical protein